MLSLPYTKNKKNTENTAVQKTIEEIHIISHTIFLQKINDSSATSKTR